MKSLSYWSVGIHKRKAYTHTKHFEADRALVSALPKHDSDNGEKVEKQKLKKSNKRMINLSELFNKDEVHLIRYKDKQPVQVEQLAGKVIVLLFAPRCVTSDSFQNDTKLLMEVYDELQPKGFEVILVTPNKLKVNPKVQIPVQEFFDKEFSWMPWAAIPYSDTTARMHVQRILGVSRTKLVLSTIYVIGPNGRILQRNLEYFQIYGALGFPYTSERIKFLMESEYDAIVKQPSLEKLLASRQRDYVITNKGEKVVKKKSVFISPGSCLVLGRSFSTGTTRKANPGPARKANPAVAPITLKNLKTQWVRKVPHLKRITKKTNDMFDLRFTTWGRPSNWSRRRSLRVHGYWVGKTLMFIRRGTRKLLLVHIRRNPPNSLSSPQFAPILQARSADMKLLGKKDRERLNKYWTDNLNPTAVDFQAEQYMKHGCLIRNTPIPRYGVGCLQAAKKFLPRGKFDLMRHLNHICKKGVYYNSVWLCDRLGGFTGFRPFLSFSSENNTVFLNNIGFAHLGVDEPILIDHPSISEIPDGLFRYS